jgi:hypothetical protein
VKAVLSSLFVLDEAFDRGAVRVEFASSSKDVDDWAVGKCTSTIALKQNSGRTFCDLVGTTHAGFYLWSQRLQDVLRKEAISGWNVCPVELMSSKGESISHYAAIGITGRCGPLQNWRSKKVTRLLPGSNAYSDCWIGLYFAEDTWDGSDLFRPDGTMLTIATSRAKEVIEGTAATNIRIRPLLEVERPVL